MSTNTSIPYESTLYESSTDDDVYFQSVGFFFMLNFLYFIGLASVHLVHWTINLVLEYKKTRSCGAKERAEGASGYLLLIVGACFPMIVGIWITIDIPVSKVTFDTEDLLIFIFRIGLILILDHQNVVHIGL